MSTETLEADIASLFQDTSSTQDLLIAKAKAYVTARKQKEAGEAYLKGLSDTLSNAETDLLRQMDVAGVKSLKLDHEGVTNSLSQTGQTYYSLPAGSIDDPAILDWLEENGAKDIIKRSIHHATFSSFCKELVENASQSFSGEEVVLNPLHPYVKVAERRGIMLRKG